MISAQDAIRVGRSLLGTPYDTLDCINYIKRIIRTAPGGVKNYTTAGTNTLWRSYEAAAKYRDLTWRQEGIAGARAGMLAFKRSGSDVHHVGLVTGEGTVLHSSSGKQYRRVVETDLQNGQWHLLAIHRYIAVAMGDAQQGETGTQTGGETMGDNTGDARPALYYAVVNTARDPLNIRDYPNTGRVVSKAPRGFVVEVLSEGEDGWPLIRCGDVVGYASAAYLARVDEVTASPQGPTDDGPPATDAVRIPLADAQAIYEALGDAYRLLSAALGAD